MKIKFDQNLYLYHLNLNHLLIRLCILGVTFSIKGIAHVVFSLANWCPLTTDPSLEQIYIIVGAVAGVVVMLLVSTAVLNKYRKRDKVAAGHSKYNMCLNVMYSMS